MIELLVVFIGALVFWRLVAVGFSLGAKATAATERTAAILEAVLPPEKRELVREFERRREEDRAAADLAYRRKRAVVLWIAILGGLFLAAHSAKAQGIYMGRDGRAHPSVIVGPAGEVHPVAPTFCTPGFGPCPVFLGPPVGFVRSPRFAPPPLPYDDAPRAFTPPPPWAGEFDGAPIVRPRSVERTPRRVPQVPCPDGCPREEGE
jgi:hypothetical protein